MSSLFKCVPLPLLAVAAAATLCTPTLAATATWAECDAPDASNPQVIRQQVECSMTDTSLWEKAIFHTQLLGGDESYSTPDFDNVNVDGPGDYYYPSGGYYPVKVIGGGTYNNWCICSGGNSGGPFYVSTGGTTYLDIPAS